MRESRAGSPPSVLTSSCESSFRYKPNRWRLTSEPIHLGTLDIGAWLMTSSWRLNGGEVITEEGGRLRISSSYGFPSLERIQIGGESCRLELTFEVGCLPKLQQLNLECMVAEENHTSSSNVVFGIEHLSRLTSVYCCIHYKYETRLAKVAMLAALERSIISHPNQPTFTKEEYGDFVDESCWR